MINELVQCIFTLLNEKPGCEINLISFNSSIYENESDYIINEKVYKRLSNYSNVKNCVDQSLRDPVEMLKFIGSHNLIIGMRFHSIVFSMIQSVPFVALHTTRKVQNLLKDFNLLEYSYDLPVDEKFKPTQLKGDVLLSLVNRRLSTRYEEINVNLDDFNAIKRLVKTKKRRQILVKRYYNQDYDDMLKKTIEMIKNYLQISDETFRLWHMGKIKTITLVDNVQKDIVDFARLICFGITNKIGVPYVWGLKDNMLVQGFNIIEAIKWIYDDYVARSNTFASSFDYYPLINPEKYLVIDMNYMCQDNYSGLHRSGWSYVISGLQHLDTQNVEKPSRVLVDTCLERTFLWGLDVTKTAKLVPYTKDWVGFVHHTFDTSYSQFNCNTLLKTDEFIKSLPFCKCLVTLSEYLKEQLSNALADMNFNIPVISVVHPTEFVENNFEIGKFVQNKNRKVVHVGAWLRNPYSIYALPIPNPNRLGITKFALKGKEMDNYFRPPWLFDKLFQVLKEYNLVYNQEHNISRGEYCQCRPETDMCRPLIVNKYLEGMLNQLKEEDDSVTIVDFISDKDYDNLFAENVVFLNLVDASASNTVIECIVRNTPIIINRLPSLEEALGRDYPGFYGSLFEAATKITDLNTILLCHEYLKKLDKTKYKLEYFIKDFQQKVLSTF
jgi:hypothetical protein